MKKFLLLSLSVLIFASCVSKPVPIPGEKNIALKNIYNEYLNIGDAYFDLGKYDKAETYYNLASENKELYWTCVYKLARVYAFQKKWDDSIVLYEKLLKRDPENLTIKSSLAYIYAVNNKLDDAIKIYEELLDKNPNDSEVMVNYIVILLASEKIDEGKKQLEILKEKFPDNANIAKIEEKIAALDDKANDDISE